MRFIIAVIDTVSGSATSNEMVEINLFNDALRTNGHWVFACGIGAPATAVVIDNRLGVAVESPGPLLSSDDYVSGFWIVEANDLATARELAFEGSKACNRRVELRPLLG